LISKGLQRLGSFYLELNTLQEIAACQRELVQVCREDLKYAENRLSIGTGTSLEVKVAQQQLELALGEQEGIALSTKRALVSLKSFLGLPSSQDFTPNVRDSRRQVIGNFDPATATLDQAKQRSYELKSMELYKQLQAYNIRLAKSKMFPTFVFNTQTPSPLSVTTGQGLYVGLGMELPVWDGFKRLRDVSRQKAVMRQVDAKTVEKGNSLEEKLLVDLADIQGKKVTWKNAETLENLARLKAHQTEVRYQSGESPLNVALDSRKEVLKIRKETLRRALDFDKAVLELRENSGDLGHTYVDEKSWQK
jgi:outer membrane protein TolC